MRLAGHPNVDAGNILEIIIVGGEVRDAMMLNEGDCGGVICKKGIRRSKRVLGSENGGESTK
jgi:hypothetical protein